MKKKTPKNKAWRDSDKPPQAYGKENEFLTRGQVSFPKLFNFDGILALNSSGDFLFTLNVSPLFMTQL